MSWQDHRLNTRLKLQADNVEKIYSMLSEIDSVKNSWKITEKLLPQTLQRLTKSVIVTSTGASNRIEGNLLTDIQVENLYKNLHVKKFKSRDEEEIAGYLECLELIFKEYGEIKLNESWILSLHNDMLTYSKKDSRHKGGYKFGSNRVEARDSNGNVVGIIFDPTPPYLVKKEMQELIDWYIWASNNNIKHPLILLANFIFEYLAIHPFQDGNGRTSRLLTNLLLLQNGYHFTQIVSHERIIEVNKVDYYLALNKTQTTWKSEKEDISPFLVFFLKVIREQSSKALAIISGEDIEYLLSGKQLTLLNWAKDRGKNAPAFSRKDAILALGFPPRTVESIILKLIDLKKLKRIGEGRGTSYLLI